MGPVGDIASAVASWGPAAQFTWVREPSFGWGEDLGITKDKLAIASKAQSWEIGKILLLSFRNCNSISIIFPGIDGDMNAWVMPDRPNRCCWGGMRSLGMRAWVRLFSAASLPQDIGSQEYVFFVLDPNQMSMSIAGGAEMRYDRRSNAFTHRKWFMCVGEQFSKCWAVQWVPIWRQTMQPRSFFSDEKIYFVRIRTYEEKENPFRLGREH